MPPGCCPMYLGKPSSSEASRIRSRQTGASILSWKWGDFCIWLSRFLALPQSTCLASWSTSSSGRPRALPRSLMAPLTMISGDSAGQGGMLPAPFLMGPQDQVFPDAAGKIEVDIRHIGHGIVGQKPFQRKLVFQRIDMRKTDQIADQQGHRRAAPSSRRIFLQRSERGRSVPGLSSPPGPA